MAQFTVTDADYLDQEAGLIIGSTVTAKPGEAGPLLYVTHLGETELPEPIAVGPEQLAAV